MSRETVELLIPLSRGAGRPLARQVEDHIRQSIRSGSLKPRALLPSTRDLAGQLGISRPTVVEAYSQLASEGFVALRQGTRPRVAGSVVREPRKDRARSPAEVLPRYDFRPATPDLRSFPRKTWLKAARKALENMRPQEFGYDARHGTQALRHSLAAYLGRVRSVVADPSQIVVTSGYAQGRQLFCRALAAMGGKRLAVEDPSYTSWRFATSAGLDVVPIPVDGEGIDVGRLARTNADGVLVTPTHQSPTGSVLSGERRGELLDWLKAKRCFALEDDYDAEFRYDRGPVGALQGLAPERVVYAGTASKTLAPGLRLGWLVVPQAMRDAILSEHRLADHGAPRIEQNTLATFIDDGDLDRHLRRMRLIYRDRRNALVSAIGEYLPEASIDGISAGLHAVVSLPESIAEQEVSNEVARRGMCIEFISKWYVRKQDRPSTILIGYAQSNGSTLRAGVRILADAIHSVGRTTAHRRRKSGP
ncbi:MAG TPA: PLP-dependent aminotransferase family protein [Steroidobacteraceae bacterium]|nr:PLP-dependent aminotransferase family protein [Steroidobacteraceae bacterium]